MPPKPTIYHLYLYKLSVLFFESKFRKKSFLIGIVLLAIYLNIFNKLDNEFFYQIGNKIYLGLVFLAIGIIIDRIFLLIQMNSIFRKMFPKENTLDNEFRFNIFLTYYGYQWLI